MFLKGLKICFLVVCVLVEVSISKAKMDGKVYRPLHGMVAFKDVDSKVGKNK
jgi:uncharacterized Zn finger protein (UPF0148 family)